MHTRQQDTFKNDLGITVDNCPKLSTQYPGMVKNTVFCAVGEGREKKQKASIGNVLWYAAVTSRVHSDAGVCRQYWASHLRNSETPLEKGEEESPAACILRDIK